MSNGCSNQSASDIITYVGVPLAVAGILPILYNTIVTLVVLHKIKQRLKHSRMTASATRSDVVNRIIEMELPRYKITPFERSDSRYWKPQQQPSAMPGGSWTALEWKKNRIATKVQRFQYVDEVKQPQAEVRFEDLIWYLLDLGAIPDPVGWARLRSNGLWTPEDQCLMRSPDGKHSVLTAASLVDSDGHLSLKLYWAISWRPERGCKVLPLQWVCLPASPALLAGPESATATPAMPNPAQARESLDWSSDSARATGHSSAGMSEKNTSISADIFCEISKDGLLHVESQMTSGPDIHHLRIKDASWHGVWYASALAAYALSKDKVPSYQIPSVIADFAERPTVPGAALVLLGFAAESEVPAWVDRDGGSDSAGTFLQARDEERRIAQADAQMPLDRPHATSSYTQHRSQRERQRWNREQEFQQQSELQALKSAPCDNAVVAQYSLRWLRTNRSSSISALSELEDVVGGILRRMILDAASASSIFDILDLWEAWSQTGGMTQQSFLTLSQALEAFAQASMLVGLVKATAGSDQGKMVADLHICMRDYQTVRLG